MHNTHMNCNLCHGRGVVKGVYGWVKCPNLSGTPAQRDAVRRLHGVGTRGYQSPFKDHGTRDNS